VRNQSKEVGKVYLLLFVCAATRAVHLEVVDSQNVSDFMLAFRRFVGRRGMPSLLRSDNAKTFLKACQILPLEWRFNPPLAPWWGGAYERLVRTVKTPLKKVIGRSLLTKVEFETVVIQVEGVVNGRPLTESPDEPRSIITPATLLGHVLTDSTPSEGLNRDQLTRRQRHLDALSRQLRKRFVTEYLVKLAKHAIRVRDRGSLRVGSLAFFVVPGSARSSWPLVRVVEVKPGVDGQVRVLSIQVPGGRTICRAVQHLVPLELDVEALEEELSKEVLKEEPSNAALKEEPVEGPSEAGRVPVRHADVRPQPSRGRGDERTRAGRRVKRPLHLKDYV
jgi:hypothetical protein